DGGRRARGGAPHHPGGGRAAVDRPPRGDDRARRAHRRPQRRGRRGAQRDDHRPAHRPARRPRRDGGPRPVPARAPAARPGGRPARGRGGGGMSVDVVIIVTALLVVAPCALLGCFLLLRRSVMVGDAISHAALPGIVLAFFLTGSLGPLAALAGAAAFGLLTVVLVDLLERGGRVRGDAATGIVFTGLFALGVLLVARYGGNVHLDLEHVLFGEIAFAP